MNPEPIEVESEDAAEFQVGDEIFGRVIERIDRDRNLIWVRGPGGAYRIRHWLERIWWLLFGAATYASTAVVDFRDLWEDEERVQPELEATSARDLEVLLSRASPRARARVRSCKDV